MQTATVHAPRALRTPAVQQHSPNPATVVHPLIARINTLAATVRELAANVVQTSIEAEAHNRDQSDFYGTGRRMRYVTEKQAAFLRRAGLWQSDWQGVVTVQAASTLIGAVIECDRAERAAQDAQYEEEHRGDAWHDYQAGEALYEA